MTMLVLSFGGDIEQAANNTRHMNNKSRAGEKSWSMFFMQISVYEHQRPTSAVRQSGED